MKQRDTKIIQLKNDLNDNNSSSFLITIDDIFNGKLIDDIGKFVILDYQRPYDWDKKSIVSLIEDINNLGVNDSHYVGIIYLGYKRFASGWSIIDGQQRIITFFILLYYFNKNKISSNDCNFDISVRINDNDKNLNEIIEKDSELVDNLLLKEYCENINANLKIIKKYFNENGIDKHRFYDIFIKKVCFIIIACLDKEMELNLFYNINSKRIELDDVDKIKTYLNLNVFNDKNSTKELYNIWPKLYKEGKSSAYLFFKILANAISGTDSIGKIKYGNLVETIEKYISENSLSSFKLEFNDTLERFALLPSDYNDLSFYKGSSSEIKNIMVSLWLSRKLRHHRRFIQEITHKVRYNDYMSGKRNPLIAFLIFLFTFICEAKFSFKNTDGQKNINIYLKWSEKDRKKKLKDLWLKFKNGNFLDDIEYSFPKINREIENISEKSKCIIPLLIIAESRIDNFYETIIRYSNLGEKIHIDHIIPLKSLLKDPINEKIKSNNYEWSEPNVDLKKIICSIYNCQILSQHENVTKSSTFDLKYCKLSSDGLVDYIDYDKIKNCLIQRKQQLIENLENVINRLIK